MNNYNSKDFKFVFLPEETEYVYGVTPVCAPGPGDE